MKRTLSVVGFLVLTVLSGFGQQTGAFFRIIAPTNTKITAFDSQGYLTWTNAATVGVTCIIQRATTLTGPSNWVNYVQHEVTNATMAARVHDPNPPAGMVWIPAGTNSGTDPDAGAYSLTVAAFYMDATEVTKAQWDAVYAWAVANGYSFYYAGSGKAWNHPVHTMKWWDCVKWCNARSQKNGRTPVYYTDIAMTQVYKAGQVLEPYVKSSANGYRLPTANQWHYAARGGFSNQRFPWGDKIDHTRANYCGNPSIYAYDLGYAGWDTRYETGERPYTSPAGSFVANGYGLYDMSGNVFEWCSDVYGVERYICGGSWSFPAGYASCRGGYWNSAALAGNSIGFRTVCR